MAQLKKREWAEEDFQMAPMIDMVFLLLVFFMCVSTMAQADKTASVDLPESERSKVPEDLSGRGIISLDKEGVIYVGAQPLSIEAMRHRIGATLKTNPELKIQLRADRETSYAQIKKVLKACAEVGAYEIIYATYQSR